MQVRVLAFLLIANFSFFLKASLIKITSVNPTILVDLRYATDNNFTKQQVYTNTADAYLLDFVAEKLDKVQKHLNQYGLGLKVWDAYRPLGAQWKFWELFPDERYVSNPAKGGEGGRHPRGTTVDVTLVSLADGKELLMPTEFDDFTQKAHADFADLPQKAITNREMLRQAMEQFGFKGIVTEWWHFDVVDWRDYPVLTSTFDDLVKK